MKIDMIPIQCDKDLLNLKFYSFLSKIKSYKKINNELINTFWFQEFPYGDFGTITYSYDEKNNILHLIKLITPIENREDFDIYKEENQYLNYTFFGKNYHIKNNSNTTLDFDFSSLNKYKFDV